MDSIEMDAKVSDAEVEKRLEKLSANAFTQLKTQLEEKYAALVKAKQTAEELKSDWPVYYSTTLLKNKFLENCRLAINQSGDVFPLDYILKHHQQELSATLKLINKEHDAIKEDLTYKLVSVAQLADTVKEIEGPLSERLDTLKSDLIDVLQNAATEYRAYLINKKEWKKRFPEFIDKFGCVVSIFGSAYPYELNKATAFGPSFGHELRTQGKLPEKPGVSVSSIKKLSLADIEKMINNVISECRFYANDSYDVLKMLQEQFDALAKKKSKYFELQHDGMFYTYLLSIKLKKDEEVKEPLLLAKSQLELYEKEQEDKVSQYIKAVQKDLCKAVDIFKSNVDKDISLIASEVDATKQYYNKSAPFCYKEIAAYHSKMKMLNSDAKTLIVSIDADTHKVLLAYMDAIQFAKSMNKDEFDKYAKISVETLASVKPNKTQLDIKRAELAKLKKLIETKLTAAKQQFDGTDQHKHQSRYASEVNRNADLEMRYEATKKDYELALVLPKAIEHYGSYYFDCAQAKQSLHESKQHLDKIPDVLQTVWASFNKMVADTKARLDFRLNEHQAKVDENLLSAHVLLQKSAECLEVTREFQKKANQKLTAAQAEFPAKIHAEHQKAFDSLLNHYSNTLDRHHAEEKSIALMQIMPQAMTDYSDLLLKTASMYEEAMYVNRSCHHLTGMTEDIKSKFEESMRLTKAGVVKSSLEVTVKEILRESDTVLAKAAMALKKAETVKLEGQKTLAALKVKYPLEMHAKPQEAFDAACNQYSLAFNNYNVARTVLTSAESYSTELQKQLVLAEKIKHEKQIATQLRQLLLNAILSNLSLWSIGKWGGGMDYAFNGHTYRIPHGIYELITGLMSSDDAREWDKPCQWIQKVVDAAGTRDALAYSYKYRLFGIRNEQTTGVLYRAIHQNLRLDGDSFESLRDALLKIPGLKLEGLQQAVVASPFPRLDHSRLI